MIRHLIITAALILSLSSLAFAGATADDITVQSAAGVVTTVGAGHNVNAETDVHSVDIQDGGHVDDVTVQGINMQTTTVGVGSNVNADSSVGSVKVGD